LKGSLRRFREKEELIIRTNCRLPFKPPVKNAFWRQAHARSARKAEKEGVYHKTEKLEAHLKAVDLDKKTVRNADADRGGRRDGETSLGFGLSSPQEAGAVGGRGNHFPRAATRFGTD